MGTSKLLIGSLTKYLRWTSVPSSGSRNVRNTVSRFILLKPEISVSTDEPTDEPFNIIHTGKRVEVIFQMPIDFVHRYKYT